MPCVEVGWCSVASIVWTHPSFAFAPSQGWSRSFWQRALSWLEHLWSFLDCYLENNTPETGWRTLPLQSEVQVCIWSFRPFLRIWHGESEERISWCLDVECGYCWDCVGSFYLSFGTVNTGRARFSVLTFLAGDTLDVPGWSFWVLMNCVPALLTSYL